MLIELSPLLVGAAATGVESSGHEPNLDQQQARQADVSWLAVKIACAAVVAIALFGSLVALFPTGA
jgi:hypothetical protein